MTAAYTDGFAIIILMIREIMIQDYDNLIGFWGKNYFVGDMDSKDRLALFLEKNPGLSILMEENGGIIGTALGSFDGRRGYIQKVVVDTDHRKRGIGKQLVDHVITKLKDLGATYIPIAVEEELVHFYTTCGFQKTSLVPMKLEIIRK
ncbi:MAG: GNAT family N-acetyltransferase [Candidatus Levyibacteriota bacterium]